MKKNRILLATVSAGALLSASPAVMSAIHNTSVGASIELSADVAMARALNFGIVTVDADDKTNNVATLTVPADGSPASTAPGGLASFDIKVGGQPGQIQLSNGTAGQLVNLSATGSSLKPVGIAGEVKEFDVTNFTFADQDGNVGNSLTVTGDGSLLINVGADLQTDNLLGGASLKVGYLEGQYSGQVEVVVTF